MKGNGQQPVAPPIDERAPRAQYANVHIEGGFVQFVGLRTLAINQDAVNVPLAMYFQVAGQLMMMASQPGPAGDLLRAALAGATLGSVKPATLPT